MKPYKIPSGYLSWKEFEKQIEETETLSAFAIVLGSKVAGIKVFWEELEVWAQGYPLYCVGAPCMG